MISPSYDFSQFATSVKGKAFDDVICDAQQELIYAWRRVAKEKDLPPIEHEQNKNYQKALKDFISFLRFSVKTVDEHDENYPIFVEVKNLMPKKFTDN